MAEFGKQELPTSIPDALGFASAHISELPHQTISSLLDAAGIGEQHTAIDHPVAMVPHTNESVQRYQ
jgi:hypothetical protein